MKPKTKMQKEVAELMPTVKPLTQEQERYGYKHCFDHIAFLRNGGKEAVCSECGRRFKAEPSRKSFRCPQCGTVIKAQTRHRRTVRTKAYYIVVETAGRFQVLRWFLCNAAYKSSSPAFYDQNEVSQIWISPDGNRVRVERKNVGWYYLDSWSFASPIEIRYGDESVLNTIRPYAAYFVGVIPELRRRGLKRSFHDMAPVEIIDLLLSDSKAETLFKAGQYPLLKHMIRERTGLSDYWPSIKICLRNGYTVKDGSMWCDLLSSLRYLEKDLHSPKYVCPQDLKAAHDDYMRLAERKRKREEDERKRFENRKLDDIYHKDKAAFLGLAITDGTLLIKPLQNVSEFEQEGDAMHHCCYECGYYKKKQSLVLSARIEDRRIETVEVSLKSFKVVQSRGVCNENTEYHDRIISLVEKNMNRIRRCARKSA